VDRPGDLPGLRASKACRTLAAARDVEPEIRQDLKGRVAAQQRAEQHPATLRLMCDGYVLDLEQRGKAPDSIQRAKDTKKRLEEFFGKRMDDPLTKLTEADLYAFRAARVKGGAAPSTVNRDFRTVRAMVKKALPGFRVPGGLFFRETETRVRWLEPLQEVEVMSRLRSPFAEMARLASLTLMRLSEVRTLKRSQVALSQGVVQLPRSKTGPDTVVLNAEAMDLLRKQLDAHTSEWVFPRRRVKRDGTVVFEESPYSRVHVGREWREAARGAGLDDFHFHDLRHHGATMALNAGFSAPIVMALGRWKTERMMRRYAAVTDKTLRAAAEAVAGNIPEPKRLTFEAAQGTSANTDCKQPANHAPMLKSR